MVLPYLNMNPPWVYTCSPSWTPLPPLSPYHPSRSSQCTSPKHLYHASNLDWQFISHMGRSGSLVFPSLSEFSTVYYCILIFCIVLFLPASQQLDLCILSFLGKASSLLVASYSPQTSGWGILCLLSSGHISICLNIWLGSQSSFFKGCPQNSPHLSLLASSKHFYASPESFCPVPVMLGLPNCYLSV